VEYSGRLPEPRSHHTATVFQKKIIFFGGFRNSTVRFNDVWIFDTESEEWSQPLPGTCTVVIDLNDSISIIF
jgi:N-acetylneuraminic acid mutarotase